MNTVSANKWTVICANSNGDALVKMLSSNFQPEAIYAAQLELAKRASASPCPNLDKWRREMEEKKRDAYVFDELWKKACEEVRAAEWNRLFAGYASPNSPQPGIA